MKNISIKSGLLALLSICSVACNSYEEPGSTAVAFGLSFDNKTIQNQNLYPMCLRTNQLAGFANISTGDIFSEWVLTKRDEETKEYSLTESGDLGLLATNSDIIGYDDDYFTTDFAPYTDWDKYGVLQDRSFALYGIKPGKYDLLTRSVFNEPVTFAWRTNWPEYLTHTLVIKSVEQSDGTHLIEMSIELNIYMLLKGECQVFKDAALTEEIDLTAEADAQGLFTIPVNTTLYFKEISGVTEFDRVDITKWSFEYRVLDAANTPDVEPVVEFVNCSDSDKVVAIKFSEAGAFNVGLAQQRLLGLTEECAYNTDSFPADSEKNYLPVTIVVE